jgi:hypothetical protein
LPTQEAVVKSRGEDGDRRVDGEEEEVDLSHFSSCIHNALISPGDGYYCFPIINNNSSSIHIASLI